MAAKTFVYLDNSATTALDKRVLQAMLPHFETHYGNPSSRHPLGVRAADAVDESRRTIAKILDVAAPRNVIFTGSGTEANNLAMLGIARANRHRGTHIIVGATEHPAVYETANALRSEGYTVEQSKLTSTGALDLDDLRSKMRSDTILVSQMLVNNLTGALYPVREMAQIAKAASPSVFLHVDAVQAVGKIPFTLPDLGVHSVALTSHKFHGPKAVGALVLADGAQRPAPLLFGGGHEGGTRSGTENVPGIVGFARALQLAAEEQGASFARVSAIRAEMDAAVADIQGVETYSPPGGIPHILALKLPAAGPPSEVYLHHLADLNVCASAGSACQARDATLPPAFLARGLSAEESRRVLRFSLSRTSTREQAIQGCAALQQVTSHLLSGAASGVDGHKTASAASPPATAASSGGTKRPPTSPDVLAGEGSGSGGDAGIGADGAAGESKVQPPAVKRIRVTSAGDGVLATATAAVATTGTGTGTGTEESKGSDGTAEGAAAAAADDEDMGSVCPICPFDDGKGGQGSGKGKGKGQQSKGKGKKKGKGKGKRARWRARCEERKARRREQQKNDELSWKGGEGGHGADITADLTEAEALAAFPEDPDMLILRVGEIALKKKNIGMFMGSLCTNVARAARDVAPVLVQSRHQYIFVRLASVTEGAVAAGASPTAPAAGAPPTAPAAEAAAADAAAADEDAALPDAETKEATVVATPTAAAPSSGSGNRLTMLRVARRLQDVFGIVSISPAWRVYKSAEALRACAVAVTSRALRRRDARSGDGTVHRVVTFAVRAKRSDKNFALSSQQLERSCADSVIGAIGVDAFKVQLKDPELKLEMHLTSQDYMVFAERLPGPCGLPVGVSGRAISLLSGGIDSPVASWLAMKRGVSVSFVSFHSAPYLGESSKRKIAALVRQLNKYQPKSRLYIIPFAACQVAIRDKCSEPYRTVLYRRMMQRIASQVAKRERALALVTGESLAQVASQTMQNMTCIGDASEVLVLRPLVTFDKVEAIDRARQIGTYDISVRPEPDCCTVFMPRGPIIFGKLEECLAAEAKLDMEKLVRDAMDGAEVQDFL